MGQRGACWTLARKECAERALRPGAPEALWCAGQRALPDERTPLATALLATRLSPAVSPQRNFQLSQTHASL